MTLSDVIEKVRGIPSVRSVRNWKELRIYITVQDQWRDRTLELYVDLRRKMLVARASGVRSGPEFCGRDRILESFHGVVRRLVWLAAPSLDLELEGCVFHGCDRQLRLDLDDWTVPEVLRKAA